MIWVATAILILAGVAYLFAPAGKTEAFLGIMTLSGGFIFGKFTNGYAGKSKKHSEEKETK